VPADPSSHHLLIGLRAAAQPRVDLAQLLRQSLALALEHRALLLGPCAAAAQHVTLTSLPAGLLDQSHLEPVLHGFPLGLLQQSPLVGAQPALRRADQVTRLAFA
jgi:hypothetical protein